MKASRDVETRWISLAGPVFRLILIWPALLLKMAADMETEMNPEAVAIFNSLTNLDLVLGVPALVPLLKELTALCKTMQVGC